MIREIVFVRKLFRDELGANCGENTKDMIEKAGDKSIEPTRDSGSFSFVQWFFFGLDEQSCSIVDVVSALIRTRLWPKYFECSWKKTKDICINNYVYLFSFSFSAFQIHMCTHRTTTGNKIEANQCCLLADHSHGSRIDPIYTLT